YQAYKTFEEDMKVDDDPCIIDFYENGYLYLLNEKAMPVFKDILKTQAKLGVKSELMDQNETQNFFPELNVDDLAGSVFDPEAGNADPYSVLQGYVKKSKQLGATFIYEEVETITTKKGKVSGVQTTEGEKYLAPIVV